jgi:uncharacterized membrane protein YdjX (TVP38/TMEM64 family)
MQPPSDRSNLLRVGLLLLLVALTVALWWAFQDRLNTRYLADREAELSALYDSRPWLIRCGAFIVYVLVTGLSIPGAAMMSMIYAWFLGFWQALLLISFASTAGAVLSMLISRYLLREWVEARFQERYQKINAAFEREGAYYLFTLRLIPLVPFFVINAVMGLTRIPVRTFWWVSQLGMLPGTIAFVYAGSTIPSLNTLVEKGASGVLNWQMFLAFAILGCLPLLLKKLVGLFASTGKTM